jgi:uncharacterized protein
LYNFFNLEFILQTDPVVMNNLIVEISDYVKQLFETHPDSFLYHNLQHTKDVVDMVKDISENSGTNEEQEEVLLIAAWFHDTGYPHNILHHEEKSAEIAQEYLERVSFPAAKIKTVKELILSTRIPQNPGTLTEKIICDADIAYIGHDDFINRISSLRDEWVQTIKKTFTDEEWIKQNIDFIEANFFHTEYARQKFGEARKKNLSLLKQIANQLMNKKN